MLKSKKKRTRAEIECVLDLLQELDSHLTEMHDALDGLSSSAFCSESLKTVCEIEEQMVIMRENIYHAYDSEVESLSSADYEYFKKEYGLNE